MADETSFYADQNGVQITDKRVVLGNTTYSLANITSVSTSVYRPSRFAPAFITTLGVCALVAAIGTSSGKPPLFGPVGFGARMIVGSHVAAWGFGGAIVALLGYFWYRGSKPVWHLRIASSSGEATPLRSTNQYWITSIAQAINEAIIHRD